MVNLTLSTPAGGSLSIQNSIKFSSCNFLAPTALLFNKRKSFFLTAQNANGTKNLSFEVKSQYFVPQEQQHHQKQPQKFSSFDSPSQSQPGQLPPRIYVGYSVYKGKAALTVEPRPPEFLPLDSGAFKVSKEGYVLLQFAPSSGVRQYDWSRKQVFSLSVTEIGNLISLGAKDSCEFFHDPFKGKRGKAKLAKISSFRAFFGVQNKLINLDESIYIPITKAEFAVFISAFNYILPYLLGWHTFANSIKPEAESRANAKSGVEYEWNR
ncbi:Single-stranded DNA-binding protein WHY1 [Forsythia ovata]|uniref:Single-stranded DNA-binding protein WHY1 n=1 Tax=Forsythia ovata TaxID=205694 RepID=A0ABD1XBC3_9LAMI